MGALSSSKATVTSSSSNKCSVSGCTAIKRGRGYCATHYSRWYTKGSPLALKQRHSKDEFHGLCDTPAYASWDSMVQRCSNPKNTYYHNYGGRGIRVCDRWFYSFLSFYQDMGERPKDFTLDRIDNDGNYTPENCRWATRQEQQLNRNIQSNNTSGFRGVTKYGKKYQVKVNNFGQQIYVSTFEDIEDAALAYDLVSAQVNGKLARFNLLEPADV